MSNPKMNFCFLKRNRPLYSKSSRKSAPRLNSSLLISHSRLNPLCVRLSRVIPIHRSVKGVVGIRYPEEYRRALGRSNDLKCHRALSNIFGCKASVADLSPGKAPKVTRGPLRDSSLVAADLGQRKTSLCLSPTLEQRVV